MTEAVTCAQEFDESLLGICTWYFCSSLTQQGTYFLLKKCDL